MMKTKTPHTKGARGLTITLAIAFVALSVVILLVNGGIAAYSNYQTLRDTISVHLQINALEASDAVATSIQEKFNTLETAAEFADLTNASRNEQQLLLQNVLGLQPAVRQVALLSNTGQALSGYSRISSVLSAPFEDQFKGDLLITAQQGERYVGPIYLDESTSEPLLLIAVPVQNALGDFQGVLAAELNLKFMWELVDQLQVGETGYAYVVDAQGNLLAFEDRARVLAGENTRGILEVDEFLGNPLSASDVTPEIESYAGLAGKTVVGYYASLGTPNWAIIVEMPTSEAYRPVVQSFISSAAIILLFALLAGLAGVVLARRLATPLIDLSRTATAVAGGNLTMEAKVDGPAEVAQVATTFNAMTSRLREMIGLLEQRVADRTKALATSTEVSRRLSTIVSRRALFIEVVQQVKDAFGYYHAHIYMYNDKKDELVMAGGTGDAGAALLAQGHSIPKGGGLVGRAAETNQVVLVPDTSKDPDWLPNPLLPETKSEVAIPISVGDEVLGVLDVQHHIANGLGQEDVDALQAIAGQVAVGMQNIEATETVVKRAAELQTVAAITSVTSAIQNVDEMLQTVVHLTQRQFGLYHAHVFTFDEISGNLVIASCGWKQGDEHEGTHGTTTIPLEQEQSLVARAGRTRQAVIVNDVHNEPGWLPNPLLPDTASELAVPLIVGDQLLGVLDVQSAQINAFTQEDANIQTTLASAVASALKNAQSAAQTRRQAERETTINLITQKIQSAPTIETALQVAARELGHALGMKPTLVALDPSALEREDKGN